MFVFVTQVTDTAHSKEPCVTQEVILSVVKILIYRTALQQHVLLLTLTEIDAYISEGA